MPTLTNKVVRSILRQIAKLPDVEPLYDEQQLKSAPLNFDSVDLVSMQLELENMLDVYFTSDEMESVRNVAELIAAVNKAKLDLSRKRPSQTQTFLALEY